METTILGKRPGEDLPAAGRKPPPPKPRTLASLSNSDSEDEFDDGADWLDGDHSLPAEFKTVEKNSFVLAGSSGIDLRSPFLRELLDSSAGRASPPASAPIKKTAVKNSSQCLPDPSDWNQWE